MDIEKVKLYSPILHFDTNEPFYPVIVGYSIVNSMENSPSFNRKFIYFNDELDYIIEYAIYWDYDIQHLYEMEHVWMYIAKDGSVLDCEASSHGRYYKGLLLDRSNLEGTQIHLFSQPGKHAFFPKVEYFDLFPNLSTCTYEEAGTMGLLISELFTGVIRTDIETNYKVLHYLKTFRFRPSMIFKPYIIPSDHFVPWKLLKEEIPIRVATQLAYIESKVI